MKRQPPNLEVRMRIYRIAMWTLRCTLPDPVRTLQPHVHVVASEAHQNDRSFRFTTRKNLGMVGGYTEDLRTAKIGGGGRSLGDGRLPGQDGIYKGFFPQNCVHLDPTVKHFLFEQVRS